MPRDLDRDQLTKREEHRMVSALSQETVLTAWDSIWSQPESAPSSFENAFRDLLLEIPHLLLVAGSFARGTSTQTSDIELLCVVRTLDDLKLLLQCTGLSKDLARYRIVRAELELGAAKASVRFLTTDTLERYFDPDLTIELWRRNCSNAVTELLEHRVNACGIATIHPWAERSESGGFVRTISRFDSTTQQPVATTETSMLIGGRVVSSLLIGDGIRHHIWGAFGLPLDRELAAQDSRFDTLVDPRSVRSDKPAK